MPRKAHPGIAAAHVARMMIANGGEANVGQIGDCLREAGFRSYGHVGPFMNANRKRFKRVRRGVYAINPRLDEDLGVSGMSVLADVEIERCVKIEPFTDKQSQSGIVSYGVSSYGYDIRVGRRFKVFTNVYTEIVDPKNFSDRAFVNVEGDHCIIPPNSFALAETVEWLEIPRDIIAICVGKSTYARCGVIVNVTPLEPEWRGKVTLEISNTTPLPAKIYANEGIAQILFLRGATECKTSYADRNGRYQDQAGLTLPFVRSCSP